MAGGGGTFRTISCQGNADRCAARPAGQLDSNRRIITSVVSGCGKTGMLVHCWWEFKMVQTLREAVWQFLEKLYTAIL